MIGGLYAITDHRILENGMVDLVEQALRGGARVIQYRTKSRKSPDYFSRAQQLRSLTREYAALLIINDDARLAQDVDADGVHIGCDDGELATIRQLVGTECLIGVSCYNLLETAVAAERSGADYVAFGSFFRSRVKPHAVHAPIELLTKAKARLLIPIVAIGGVTAENGAALISAGADALAVISEVFAQPEIEHAARRLANLFEQQQADT